VWFVIVVGGGLKARAVESHFGVVHRRVLALEEEIDDEDGDEGESEDDEGRGESS